MNDIETLTHELVARAQQSSAPQEVLKAPEIKQLYSQIKNAEDKAAFGQQVNALKQAILVAVEKRQAELDQKELPPIDVTAPMDVNAMKPGALPANTGSIHPLTQEMDKISDIFYRMGFATEDSREIDDQYHMFESLNFPKGHPARDEWDTFVTEETDAAGDKLIAPAHTSTMQNRVLKKYADNLERGEPIAVVVPDRTFRNEDLDARHEHTFYQVEGVYVSKDVTVGNLVATLKEFLQTYYEKELEVRVNPFYFPFTEPSFEFGLSCPFCEKKGCNVCSMSGWIELLGCGMIHPNVLDMAGIDSNTYTGFAFGCGVDRLVMMKAGIEDVRHFESGKLDFLRQF